MSAPVTDDIPEDLFESLPDLGFGSGPAHPNDGALLGVLSDVRRSMEAAFQHEMDRLEGSFGAILRQTEARLVQANLDLAAARAEHERTRQEHARKSLALRELKRALEGL